MEAVRFCGGSRDGLAAGLGGAGLVSSLDDYMRFARMLLNRGSLDGVQILRPSTVKLMSTDQLDPKIKDRYRDPQDVQSRLLRGFAQERCGGKIETKDDEGQMTLSVTLKAKM